MLNCNIRTHVIIELMAIGMISVGCSYSRPEIPLTNTPSFSATFTTTPRAIPTHTNTPRRSVSPIPSNTAFPTTTVTPTQSKTPTAYPSPTMTTTFDYAKYVNAWSTYNNEKYAFSFEYPTIYTLPPYSDCRVRVFTSKPWIFYLNFGHRSELAIANNDLPSFSEYVDRWVQSRENPPDWSLWSRYGRVINSSQAATIEFSFSIRWGTTTFFGQKQNIYIFNWTAGGGCDIPEIKLYEYDAYNHALETFKFTP